MPADDHNHPVLQSPSEFTTKHVTRPLTQITRRAQTLERIIERCSEVHVPLHPEHVRNALTSGTLTIGVSGLARLLGLEPEDTEPGDAGGG